MYPYNLLGAYAAHLIDSFGFPADDGIVRVSLVYYNTFTEVDRIIGALQEIWVHNHKVDDKGEFQITCMSS
jgi:hypothetical protein